MLTSSRLGSRSSIDAPPAQVFRRAWRPGAKAHSTIRGSTTCGAASTRANERVYGVLTTADTQASELHGSIQAKDGVSVAANPPSSSSILYRFVVPSYETRFGENLVVVGDLDELGSWQLEAAASMSWQEGHRWVLEARLPRRSFEFKVVVVSGSSVRWEQGVNRVIQAEGRLAEVPVELVINLTCHFDLTHATPLELELNRSSIQSNLHQGLGQVQPGPGLIAGQLQSAADENRLEGAPLGPVGQAGGSALEQGPAPSQPPSHPAASPVPPPTAARPQPTDGISGRLHTEEQVLGPGVALSAEPPHQPPRLTSYLQLAVGLEASRKLVSQLAVTGVAAGVHLLLPQPRGLTEPALPHAAETPLTAMGGKGEAEGHGASALTVGRQTAPPGNLWAALWAFFKP
ncbi:hypothetical protein V8C86DRAFT_3032824 [Haematococcus lacustris]